MNINFSRLFKILKENKLINEFFSAIPEDSIIELLDKLGKSKKVTDKETFIKANTVFLRSRITEDPVSELALILWLKKILKEDEYYNNLISNKIKMELNEDEDIENSISFNDKIFKFNEEQIEEIKENRKEKSEIGSEIFSALLIKNFLQNYSHDFVEINEPEEIDTATTSYDTDFLPFYLLKKFLAMNKIWEAYLITSIILVNNEIKISRKKELETDYINKFKSLDIPYLKEVHLQVEEFIRTILKPEYILDSYKKLTEHISSSSEEFIGISREITKGIIPTNKQANKIFKKLNIIGKGIESYKSLLSQALLFYNIKLDEHEEIKELSDFNKISDKIQQVYEIYEKKESKYREALDKFNKALLIEVKNNENADELRNFKEKVLSQIKQITEEPESQTSIDILNKVSENNHPICLLLKKVSGEILKTSEEIKEFMESVQSEYDTIITTLSIQGMLYLKDKDANEKEITEKVTSSPYVEKPALNTDEVNKEISEAPPIETSVITDDNKIEDKNVISADISSIEEQEATEHNEIKDKNIIAADDSAIEELKDTECGEVIEEAITSETLSIEERKDTVDEVVGKTPDKSTIKETEIFDDKKIDKKIIKPSEPEDEAYTEEDYINNFFNLEDSSETLARKLLEKNVENRTELLNSLTWHLLLENRPGLAFHISHAVEKIQITDRVIEKLKKENIKTDELKDLSNRLFTRKKLIDELKQRGYNDDKIKIILNHAIIHPSNKYGIPSWLIRAISLSRHIRYDTSDIAKILKEDFSHFDENIFTDDTDWNHAIRLLLVSATLCPAMLAPNSEVLTILSSIKLKDGQKEFYNYCQSIQEYGYGLRPLDLNSLKVVKTYAAWEHDVKSLQKRAVDWFSCQAPNMTLLGTPATKVWLEWQKPGGLIYYLINLVRKNDVSLLEQAKEDIYKYSCEAVIKKLADETDRKVLKRTTSKDIINKAHNNLFKNVSLAVRFVKEWVSLQEIRPDKTKGYIQQKAEKLRNAILENHKTVIEQLEAFKKKHDISIIHAGTLCCKKAIEKIYSLFDPDKPVYENEPEVKELLNSELLKMPSIILNYNWEPENYDNELITQAILEFIGHKKLNWLEAFNEQGKKMNHEATEYIINYLTNHIEERSSIDLNEMIKIRESQRDECDKELLNQIKETRKKIESAVLEGILSETERSHFSSIIDQLILDRNEAKSGRKPKILRFFEIFDKLKDIKDKIDQKQNTEIERIKEKLEKLPKNSSHERISNILNQGDIFTVNEYINRLLRGESLPLEQEDKTDFFLDFFEDKHHRIIDYLFTENGQIKPPSIQQIIKDAERGSIGPVYFGRFPKEEIRQTVSMLTAWYTSFKTNKIKEDSIRCIMDFIGFNTQGIYPVKSMDNNVIFDVMTEVISDRNLCPVPRYGSEAKGQYRCFFLWGKPTEEDIINDIGETPARKSPVIVIHFDRMTSQRRRNLARICQDRRRTFILVDQVLMLYLCGHRGSRRLPVMFSCTLPFTFMEPYTDTAGLVPNEMFYGRQREKDSIIEPFGSCFIYGGRQLGKTALLKNVEKHFHEPDKEKISLYIDLKVERIVIEYPIDSIWNLLAEKLKNLQKECSSAIIPLKASAQTGPDTILEHIYNWLKEKPERRILLLLDEADDFLESDGKKDFANVARMKGLMDKTERRFKVVFAGLHNVQRTIRQANQPLAHLGEPICIGPLLNNGEFRNAQELIKHPLESLGYRFESIDLVMRIISQTNYYPSLIQLYCKYLLRHISGCNTVFFDTRKSPPYIITSKHLDEAYKNQDLREAIRYRFTLTLDLDPRYEVIALALALYSISEEGGRLENTFTASQIREDALTWWNKGFYESASGDSFRVLLDEMVGLGILRNEDGKYALRSPNVITLLGTLEEIEKKLEASENREPSLKYEPAVFRAAYGISDTPDSSRRNPLTADQESKLRLPANGVSIVFGCDAAGLNEVTAFMKDRCGKLLINHDMIPDKMAFTKHLDSIKERTQSETTVFLINPLSPWTFEWVDIAIKKVKKLTSKKSFLHIGFLCDPSTSWSLIQASDNINFLDSKDINIINLQPWHDSALRQWLEDCNFGATEKKDRKKLSYITGNWPLLLKEFYNKYKVNRHKWTDKLNELKTHIQTPEYLKALYEKFGLNISPVNKILKLCSDLGDISDNGNKKISQKEIFEYIEDIPVSKIKKTLYWADMLNFIKPVGNNYLEIDPLVDAVLKHLELEKL